MNMTLRQTLYTDPWLILPEVHRQICEIASQQFSAETTEPSAEVIALFDRSDEEDLAAASLRRQGIALISVHGVIGKRVGEFEKWWFGMVDVDDIEVEILAAERDPAIGGILIDFNTPGGRTIGVPELAQTIRDVEKPVVAFSEMTVASAGIWLAHGADIIVTTGSATVGCIGVFIAILDARKAFEANGFEMQVFKDGIFKGMGIHGTSLTPEQAQSLQDRVERIGDQFAAFLVSERDVPADAMEGQVFDGFQAADNRIVDRVGNLEDAISELEELIDDQN